MSKEGRSLGTTFRMQLARRRIVAGTARKGDIYTDELGRTTKLHEKLISADGVESLANTERSAKSFGAPSIGPIVIWKHFTHGVERETNQGRLWVERNYALGR